MFLESIINIQMCDLTYKNKIRFCLLHVITAHKGSYIMKLV